MKKKVQRREKNIFLILALVFVSAILSISYISAADVAYIYKSKARIDQNVINVFNEMNLTVETINERNLTQNFSRFKFIFVGNERFKNYKKIPINEFPSVISNYYFGYQWGLTDNDGISKLAATSPLSVEKDGQIIQVYTQARYDGRSISIPYFYLGTLNKVPNMQQIAGTYSGDGYDLGDVISFAPAGTYLINGKNTKGDMCYYGIIESKYWTPEARQLFKDCVASVAVSCTTDSQCGSDINGSLYCSNNGVNQNITHFSCQNPGTAQSVCVSNNIVKSVSNCTVNQTCQNAMCMNVNCRADIDCGTNGFNPSSLICQNNNVFGNFITFKCVSPNTPQSNCTSMINFTLKETCLEECLNGICIGRRIHDLGFIDFTNTVNKIQLLFFNDTIIPDTLAILNCGTTIKGKVRIANKGNFTENATVIGNIGNISFNLNDITNLASGDTADRSILSPYLNLSLPSGLYNITFNINAVNDNNPLDNGAIRQLQINCYECNQDSDCLAGKYCLNHFCVPIICFNNTQCGQNGFINGLFCQSGNVFQNYITYTCNNPGTAQSSCTNSTNPLLNQTCLQGQVCSNGNCFNVTCNSNSQCGTDGFIGNKYCSNGDSYQNYTEFLCSNPNTPNSNCSSTTSPRLFQDCGNSQCLNGICINITCSNSSQCDDLNLYTYDQCNNAGTPSSYCSHTLLNCVINNDCGTTGFVGNEFCSGNSVYKNFQNSTCRNPATTLSYCEISLAPVLLTNCGNGSCSNGACIVSTCVDNDGDTYDTCSAGQPGDDGKPVDCNDNNANVRPNAVEICNGIDDNCNGQIDENNGNCAQGQVCSNGQCQNIICNNNTQCGTDGYIGSQFCQSGNVFQNYITYTCANPGTAQSSCSSSSSPQLRQTCQFGCSNGTCIVSTCVDDDGDTYDTCSAGQPGDDGKPVDCNDNNANVRPNAVEICNGIDDNCNGQIDENNGNCAQGQTCTNGQCVNIACSTNAQCGTNGFVGGMFCINGDVYQGYITFTCNAPGTANSYCTNTTTNQLRTDCPIGQTCSNGACATITCSSNAQCGTDGYIGSQFCQSGNVFQNYITYTCANPGTAQSSCSSSSSPQLRQTCQFGCSNGACITSTCVDNDGDTYDTCSAGQPGDDGKPVDCNDNNANVRPNAVEICNGIDDNCNGQIDENNGNCAQGQTCTNGQCVNIACSTNAQCGTNGFVGGMFCINGDVYQGYITFTCNAPETANSYCTNTTTNQLRTDCPIGQTCSNGACATITCSSNAQCGTDGFNGNVFCQNGNIFQNYITYTCNNPGSAQSSCTNSNISQLRQTCQYGCVNGACIVSTCIDNDHDSYDNCNAGQPGDDGKLVDCNDNNFNVHPNAVELCNGIDDNCNGQIDENNGNCAQGKICSNSNCINIACYTDTDCNDGNQKTQDKCNSPGTISSFCTNLPITCLTNSECGFNGFSGNVFCQNNDVFQNYITYTCNFPGTSNSFCTSSLASQLKTDCSLNQGCFNGQCVQLICLNDNDCNDNNAKTIDLCLNPGTIQSICSHSPITCLTNSECGANGFIGNLFCQSNDIFQNYITYTCNSPGTSNSFCTSSIASQLKTDCSLNQGCFNGQCISITCSSDSDCNDGNQKTQDKCNAPGTSNSFCTNLPITCLTNSECGANGFIGNLFCQSNDVFQNYITYTCNSPGTSNSFCTSSIASQLKTDCPANQGCSNGQCALITCFNDNDCNDNNPNTIDQCLNPGTTQSSCTHTVIVCSNNAQCGTDGFTGSQFCQSGNVFQNYITYTCANPGTAQSSCSSSSSPQLRQTCQFGCSNGTCIVSTCVDNDGDTYDTCSAGQPGDDGKPVDCNDNNANVRPNAVEICNGIDDNCNGQIDENNGNCAQGQVCSNGQCVNIACSTNAQCGTNGFVGGMFCINGDVYQGYITFTCNAPGTANSYCTNTTTNQLRTDCPANQGCSNGQCAPITCFNDNDCNDNNPNTIDQCLNPGTTQSSCTHTTILCSTNAQCGTDGFTGSQFCQSGNVFQNYITYTCANPGTAQSSCSSSSSPQLRQTCQFGCSNGTCIVSTCVDNDGDTYDTCSAGQPGDDGKPVDCNDNNANVRPNAVEICNGIDDNCNGQIDENNGNCAQGQVCSNGQCVNIACSTNAQCGTNGFVGGMFCINGDVYQGYITFTCNAPGTANSYCTNTTTNQLRTDCPANQGCSNGQCAPITCFNDNDCNDNNPNTIDQCLNPGTTQSSCTHTVIVCSNNAQCGTDGFTGSQFCQSGNVFQNYITYTCANPGTTQSSCSSSSSPQLRTTCSSGQTCSNGNCISVACSTNSQCGTDGFTGSQFCQSGNVFQNYITYTCANPGTAQSSCSSSSSPQLRQTCQFGCSNGACIVSTCVDNDGDTYDTCSAGQPGDDGKPVDCNDNNANVRPNAVEICNGIDDNCNGQIDENNGNCAQGQTCTNGQCVNIACSTNAQCGTNGFVGSVFCQNSDIYQNYTTYTCNNPGTGQSSCTSSISAQLKTDCNSSQTCSNGQCICYNDPNNGLTWSSVGDPFPIRTLVNNNRLIYGYIFIPDQFNGAGALYADTNTALKVCNIAGYSTLVSYDCYSPVYEGRCGWNSCGDNYLAKWESSINNFQLYNACSLGNQWLSTVYCINKINTCS